MCRPYGTLTLLSALMREVYKDLAENQTDDETWSWVARDILLDTWTTLLQVPVITALACIPLIPKYRHICLRFSVLLRMYLCCEHGLVENPYLLYFLDNKTAFSGNYCLGNLGL